VYETALAQRPPFDARAKSLYVYWQVYFAADPEGLEIHQRPSRPIPREPARISNLRITSGAEALRTYRGAW
jgi:hypothetical protein